MVHSALKRKRYSGESVQDALALSTTTSLSTASPLTSQTPFVAPTFTTSAFYEKPSPSVNPLLSPPLHLRPHLHSAISAPSHDPRPSLKILLDLMTPTEFARLLRARIERLLTKWPPLCTQSQATQAQAPPSPTASSSSSLTQFKNADLPESQDPSPAAIRAFIAFWKLEDVRTPFSFTLPDLHTHLLALQTLLSFLTSRELREIVKARLNAEGDEQERWIAVQGVLDVLRNASGEDEDVQDGVTETHMDDRIDQRDQPEQSWPSISMRAPEPDHIASTQLYDDASQPGEEVGTSMQHHRSTHNLPELKGAKVSSLSATEHDNFGMEIGVSGFPSPASLQFSSALSPRTNDTHVGTAATSTTTILSPNRVPRDKGPSNEVVGEYRTTVLEPSNSTHDIETPKPERTCFMRRAQKSVDSTGQKDSRNFIAHTGTSHIGEMHCAGSLSSHAPEEAASQGFSSNSPSTVYSGAKSRSTTSPQIPTQDAETDIDMEMSDDEGAGGAPPVTLLEDQDCDSLQGESKKDKANKSVESSAEAPLARSRWKPIVSMQGTLSITSPSKTSDASGLRKCGEGIETLCVSRPHVPLASSGPSPHGGDRSLSSREPAVKPPFMNVASERTPHPTLSPLNVTPAPVSSRKPSQIPCSLSPSHAPGRQNPPRRQPSTVGLVRPAPTFVSARYPVRTCIDLSPSGMPTAIPYSPALFDSQSASKSGSSDSQANKEFSYQLLSGHGVQPQKEEFATPIFSPNPTMPVISRENITPEKREIDQSINGEREMKERGLRKQHQPCGELYPMKPLSHAAAGDSTAASLPSCSSVTSPQRQRAPAPSSSFVSTRKVIPTAPRTAVVRSAKSIFVAPTNSPTGVFPLPANPPRTLRPEGPEPPPPFEAIPTPTEPQEDASTEKSREVNAPLKDVSAAVPRGRSRSRSVSTGSGRSESQSHSSSCPPDRRRSRQHPRHRLPRRPSSISPSLPPRRFGSCSSSRSRSQRRSPSHARLRPTNSRRSVSRSHSDTPSRSRSPPYRRRKFSYSRPYSPPTGRESPVRNNMSNGRHWSPDRECLPRGSRSATTSETPRSLPSGDHWSPGMYGKSRRAIGLHRARRAHNNPEAKGQGMRTDILAQPMKCRGTPPQNKGSLRRK